MKKKAAVLLAPGFEEVEAVTPIDFLRRAGVTVTVLGVGGREITGSRGVTIRTDSTVEQADAGFDAVVVPGGMPGAENVAVSEESLALIRRVAGAGGLVCAICAAPAVVLAGTGLLSGKRATCYPGFEERFSLGVTFSEERVVEDGNFITSRGPGTAAEFAVAIIRRLVGDESARAVHEGTLQKR
jgi:protein deglycase